MSTMPSSPRAAQQIVESDAHLMDALRQALDGKIAELHLSDDALEASKREVQEKQHLLEQAQEHIRQLLLVNADYEQCLCEAEAELAQLREGAHKYEQSVVKSSLAEGEQSILQQKAWLARLTGSADVRDGGVETANGLTDGQTLSKEQAVERLHAAEKLLKYHYRLQNEQQRREQQRREQQREQQQGQLVVEENRIVFADVNSASPIKGEEGQEWRVSIGQEWRSHQQLHDMQEEKALVQLQLTEQRMQQVRDREREYLAAAEKKITDSQQQVQVAEKKLSRLSLVMKDECRRLARSTEEAVQAREKAVRDLAEYQRSFCKTSANQELNLLKVNDLTREVEQLRVEEHEWQRERKELQEALSEMQSKWQRALASVATDNGAQLREKAANATAAAASTKAASLQRSFDLQTEQIQQLGQQVASVSEINAKLKTLLKEAEQKVEMVTEEMNRNEVKLQAVMRERATNPFAEENRQETNTREGSPTRETSIKKKKKKKKKKNGSEEEESSFLNEEEEGLKKEGEMETKEKEASKDEERAVRNKEEEKRLKLWESTLQSEYAAFLALDEKKGNVDGVTVANNSQDREKNDNNNHMTSQEEKNNQEQIIALEKKHCKLRLELSMQIDELSADKSRLEEELDRLVANYERRGEQLSKAKQQLSAHVATIERLKATTNEQQPVAVVDAPAPPPLSSSESLVESTKSTRASTSAKATAKAGPSEHKSQNQLSAIFENPELDNGQNEKKKINQGEAAARGETSQAEMKLAARDKDVAMLIAKLSAWKKHDILLSEQRVTEAKVRQELEYENQQLRLALQLQQQQHELQQKEQQIKQQQQPADMFGLLQMQELVYQQSLQENETRLATLQLSVDSRAKERKKGQQSLHAFIHTLGELSPPSKLDSLSSCQPLSSTFSSSSAAPSLPSSSSMSFKGDFPKNRTTDSVAKKRHSDTISKLRPIGADFQTPPSLTPSGASTCSFSPSSSSSFSSATANTGITSALSIAASASTTTTATTATSAPPLSYLQFPPLPAFSSPLPPAAHLSYTPYTLNSRSPSSLTSPLPQTRSVFRRAADHRSLPL